MNLLEKESLNKKEKKALLHLWNSEYPINLNYSALSEFESYLDNLEDQFHLLVILDDQIKGWYFDFLREGERWFGLILHSNLQGKGIGTHVLSRIKSKRSKLHGWIILHDTYLKANGQPYNSPQEFYLKNGFNIFYGTKLQTRKISAVQIIWNSRCCP